jgi:hypothetical protein
MEEVEGDENIHCFPIAPALEITLGFWLGIAFVPLFAPSLSAAAVVLSVTLPLILVLLLGVDWFAVPSPSCSWRGPVDLGIEFVGEKFDDVRICSGSCEGTYM